MKKLFLLLLTAFPLFHFGCGKDDPPSNTILPTLSVGDQSVSEGAANATLVFKVTMSEAAATAVSVQFATSDLTAKAGEDFTASSGQLSFAAGETEKTISITVVNDVFREDNEELELKLSAPSGATLARATAKGLILNEDTQIGGIPTTGYSTPLSYPGKTLVWQDEFSGAQLNTFDWTHEVGTGVGGWGNNELQFYRPENTFLTQDMLVIEAKKENYGGAAYTSSRIVTKDKKSFKFGRVDIRAVLPKGQGIWPALWMLGQNIGTVGWPTCGEIDIMELVGHEPGTVHGTAHYGASFAQHAYKGESVVLPGTATFSDEFHVFSIIWEENSIQWLVDDVPFFSMDPSKTGAAPWPFNLEHFFIFNVAVGGNWPGSPNTTTVFPQRMLVDYVRVFQ